MLLSVAGHGMVALTLFLIPGPSSRAALDTCVVDDGRELALSMADLPVLTPAVVLSGEEEQHAAEADFAVDIREPVNDDGRASTMVPAPVVGPAKGPTSRPGGSGPGRGNLLLAAPATARSVVYVVDRSLSMGLNGALARARRELLASLAELAPGSKFQVILYNRQAEPLRIAGRSGYLSADEATLLAVSQEIGQVTAAGNTDHVRALKAALRLQPDVLFLVTDADDLTDPQVQEVTRLNAGHTKIHCVELSRRREDSDGPLRRLAEMNGGSYRRVPAVD
jgi:hypothetical protein